ncbi:MAG TPA: alpha/beta fold hydrolase [candidate division Zixibacteria bacterium]|nr:alpha/beta fold hydrolase [candidate division Zixibacteria bacterium]
MRLVHTLYEPAGAGPHPTLLALHGRGANAFDLLGLAPYLCGGRFLVICPQAPIAMPIGPEATGYAWYPAGGTFDVDAALSSRAELDRFIDDCVGRYPVDPGKLVLMGFSQGGVMAYALALAHPGRFAALVALSSWLPDEIVSGAGADGALRSLPVLVQHGSEDRMIEVGRAHASVERLRELRAALTYREYDMGHEITPRSLADLSAWLEEKIFSPLGIVG